jgi:tryptophanyl-tRNA synthetase
MERVVSGIQPTGELHIGNYLGATEHCINLLEKYECIFFIADYHAITIEYSPSEMKDRVINTAMSWMASGLDPKKCLFFVQSQVPEHTELCWILNTVTPMGELSRMTQFKEKARYHKKNINAGLFNYPVLMAADILLYKASIVPAGEDQVQHIELCRDIARRFNLRYKKIFPEPKPWGGSQIRILGLDGKTKMSKSLNNHIGLCDDPNLIWEKLKGAYTDEARKRRHDPGRPTLCNMFSLHNFFSSSSEKEKIKQECMSAGIGCFDCKKILHKNISLRLAPIRERFYELSKDPKSTWEILNEGALKSRKIAQNTLQEVKETLGLFRT